MISAVLTVCILLSTAGVLAVADGVAFTDISSSAYYYTAVEWAVQNNVTSGVSATSFAPNANCTRGQVVSFLYRAGGGSIAGNERNPFYDVKASNYFYKPVLWAVKSGVTSGVSATSFAPDAYCTRAQVVSFLWRAAGCPTPAGKHNPFYDVAQGKYYTTAVLWAVENGITSGVSATSFAPNAVCTRAQVVSFLYRFYCPIVVSGEIYVMNKTSEKYIRSAGSSADLATLGQNEYFSFVFNIKNNSGKRLDVTSAYVKIDGGEPLAWGNFSLEKGQKTFCHVYYTNMQSRQRSGSYTAEFYLNGQKAQTKTFVLRNSAYSDFSGYWGDVFPLPSQSQISAYKNPNNLRSQYLAGYFNIQNETRYTEYSVDFKADYLPLGTYCSLANFHLDQTPLKGNYSNIHSEYTDTITGYGGLQRTHDGFVAIMSIWDTYMTDRNGRQVTLRPKLVYPVGSSANVFGGEGTGAQYITPYKWESSHWYRMLWRCTSDPATGNTIIAMYICDLETMEWTKICAYDTLIKGTSFIGMNGVFLENYLTQHAGQVRSMEIANGRILNKATGSWEALDMMYIMPNASVGITRYDGSYAFGVRNDRFYMITSGVGGDWYNSGRGQKAEWYTVPSTAGGAPYTRLP